MFAVNAPVFVVGALTRSRVGVDEVRKIVADGGDTDDVDPEDPRPPARRTPGLAYSRTLLNVADLQVGPPAVLTDRLSTRR